MVVCILSGLIMAKWPYFTLVYWKLLAYELESCYAVTLSTRVLTGMGVQLFVAVQKLWQKEYQRNLGFYFLLFFECLLFYSNCSSVWPSDNNLAIHVRPCVSQRRINWRTQFSAYLRGRTKLAFWLELRWKWVAMRSNYFCHVPRAKMTEIRRRSRDEEGGRGQIIWRMDVARNLLHIALEINH